jgi:hypothetical protein
MNRLRAAEAFGNARNTAIGTLLWTAALGVGCGAQAGGDYMGEPLLSMRIQATVSALTDGQAMVQALCFFGVPGTAAPFDPNKLPPSVRSDLAYSFANFPGFPPDPPQGGISILDVQSQGHFPAEFEVEVYQPPADAAATAIFDGEPRAATGNICAVRAGHLALTHPLKQKLIAHCDQTCFRESVFVSYDTPRFYVERYDCPTATTDADLATIDLATCTKTTQGDTTLPFEKPAESVLGTSEDGDTVVYLPKPAPAGSYTAWSYGSTRGLSAGYHVFRAPQAAAGQPSAMQPPCDFFAEETSEIQAAYDPEIKQLYGDSYTINMFPVAANGADGVKPLPPDVVEGGLRISARVQMQRCPPPNLQEIDPSKTTISIQIRALSDGSAGGP